MISLLCNQVHGKSDTEIAKESTKYATYKSNVQLTNQMSYLPVRCYTCGKIIKSATIEARLKHSEKNEDQTLEDIMNDLGYTATCCRVHILTAQPSNIYIDCVKQQKKGKRKCIFYAR